MAAVSLVIVYRWLSPAAHALLWAASCGLAAVQWGIVALTITPAGILSAQTMTVDVSGVVALLLLVEGFRLRATGQAAGLRECIAAAIVLALVVIVSASLSILNSRAALGLIAAGLLLAAAYFAVPAGRRRRPAEIATTLALCFLAAARVGVTIAALTDPRGIALIVVQQLIALPAAAIEGLFTMLIIASDFSAARYRLVHTDPLTGVLNRLGFEAAAGAALRRSRKPAQSVSLAIADIDRFKSINDQHGHTVGDRTLGCVARHFETLLDDDDIVGRIGGEEFALLLWGDDADAAFRRIEPLRSAVREVCADIAPDLAVTASFGIAEQGRGEGLTSLLDRADRALYRSKREGRDRSTLAEARA